MHTNKKLVALTVVMVLAIGPAAIAAPNLSNKAAGRTGTTVVNTILSGVGVPSKTLGINGDFYIDTKNANLYGPKTNGVWKLTTSLRPLPTKASPTVPGATGSTGATGSAGASGLIGPRGLPGATGERGATGPSGATGSNGLPGTAGTNGLPGTAGAPGTPGTAGATGATGPAGSSGTVFASQSSITFADQLAGSSGSTTSSEAFGSFEAGKSYVVRVLISSFDVNKVATSYGIGLTVTASTGSPGISSSYVVSTGTVYSGSNRITISIIADIVLNGISVATPYSLVATLTSGATVGASITANGSYTKIQVGAIG
jgi:Collagen triple helix repeat (20 copies)